MINDVSPGDEILPKLIIANFINKTVQSHSFFNVTQAF